ncbi:protein artemis isoform X2 [Boleophthalmus pectinirostris]|uniref:protein artemis isoform X2 n=1 Tax=Boleophthalmus pectinirostris TaxID=150288 RepID=UPI002431B20A|nr:protein artemis isoform X2 [Boleophthalmus pectinirostris]
MSSFAGRMKEYSKISLDRFDRENIHARAYFLSHCHKDHMKGLKGPLLKRKLQSSRTVRLYCSFVTKELLLSNPKYSFWEDYIVPLELESPTQISLVDEASGEKEDIVVTLLPAGHCPGSVMFLFEGCQGNVLYTGDFRVKEIQSVYVDSTFYDPRYYQIPSRDVCLNGILELVGNWISQSPYHVVWLNCKAAYGYEYLFTNLGEEFKTQIHINNLAMFKKMPEILNYVTTDTKTQIHACRHPKDEEFFQGNRLPCGCTAADGTPLQIISIKPSTIWFGERSKKTNVIIKTGASSFRACFSFHSSYSEIKEFLLYLKPINIYPNVIPIGKTLTEVTHLLNQMCRQQSNPEAFIYKPLGVLKRTRMEQAFCDSDNDDGLFDGLDLAPVRKKTPMQPEIFHDKNSVIQQTENTYESVTEDKLLSHNYLDCTESNSEEEGDEEEEEDVGKGDMSLVMEEVKLEEKKDQISSHDPPKWEDFYTSSLLTDSQLSQSQSGCSSSTRLSDSQTPELFSDETDEEQTSDSSESQESLSASMSNHSSQNQNSTVSDTVILQPGQSHLIFTETETEIHRDSMDLPDSQTSSDFDIPCTPDSKIPGSQELRELYRKLASGEDVLRQK